MADELETLIGTVEKLNCQKPTFCAGRIRSGGRDVSFSVRGHCALGDTVTVHGVWEVDPKWGRQFKGKHLVPSLPLDTRGLRKWIEHNVPHVGIVTACRLVDEFGLTLMDKCAADPQAVAIAGRCPLDSINYMAEEWRKASITIGTVSWLMGHELTEKQAKAVFARYGPSSVSVVQADPFELLGSVDGFGWTTTDALAKSLGIVGEDPRRMRGSVVAVVREKQDDGSTCVNVRGACNLAGDRMGLAGDLFLPHIESVVAEKRLVRFGDGTEETDWLATTQAYRNEVFIWKSLQRSRERNPFLSPNEDADALAEQYRKMPGLTLDDTQVAAVATALKYRLSVVCGSAGSGKTQICKSLVKAYEDKGVRVLLAGPTGKSARRMTEVIGHAAHTIHRLLGYRGGVLGNGESQFTWNKDCPLNEYAVIIDECFPYKQPILTENGWEHIGKIVHQRMNVKVWSRNPVTGVLELKPVVGWMRKDAPEKILKIDTTRSNSRRDARVIRCTATHKVLTPSGYVKACDLKAGDEVIASGWQPTPLQMSVMVGSIFGDGSLSGTGVRTSPQLKLMQGIEQADYLDFKLQILAGHTGRVKEVPSGYEGGKTVRTANVGVCDEHFAIRREMVSDGGHASGRKRWAPTDAMLARVDAAALAIWFLDNGSVSDTSGRKTLNANLHTQRFSKESNERIRDFFLTKFGLTCNISENRGLYYLRFNKADSAKLFAIIKPFVPACMSRKIPGANFVPPPQEDIKTCVAKIRSIIEEDSKKHGPNVFDIEVADNHNYIAGNIVVSNCSMVDSSLAYHLLSALGSKTSIVFVGDPNQLPPVGAGSMLRDIIAHNLAPVVQLQKCHRQAGALKENCIAVLEGRIANSVVAPKDAQGSPTGTSPWLVHHGVTTDSELRGALRTIVTKMLAEWNCAESPMQSQFMAAKKDGEFGVKQMNLILQHLYQKDVPEPLPGAWKVPPTIRKGDKVIQGRNNYDLNVMNGETGIVCGIDLTHDELMIELGYVAPPLPPAAEFASTLFSPILPVTDGRETLCPVCLAVREIVAAGGWHEMRCAKCGIEYVATDGSAPPKVRPRRDVDSFADLVPSEPAKRRKFREEDVVADYVVAFPDRVVSYPKGTGGDLELAYCISIHRCQGSQMPCAITLIHKANWFIQNRSLLYTAVTRATKTCVLLGDKMSMDRAAEKVVVDERDTLLRCFAQSEQSRP